MNIYLKSQTVKVFDNASYRVYKIKIHKLQQATTYNMLQQVKIQNFNILCSKTFGSEK